MSRTSFGRALGCRLTLAGCARAQPIAAASENVSVEARSTEDIVIEGGRWVTPKDNPNGVIPRWLVSLPRRGSLRSPLPLPSTRHTLVARKSALMDALVHNIVLRTVLYYIVLFGVAKWVYGLPLAEHLVKASFDALMNSPVFGMSKSE